ncbi:MAG: F0F1 ATP synthase subunit delta [Chloroflexia bacterium]|nr:F0F1 ATP synthase subunit delta [Chloroflexia bacterium]
MASAAKRYAQAVVELATERGTLDDWQRDLNVLAEFMARQDMAPLFQSPNVPEAQKEQMLDTALADAQPEARNLAKMLIARERLAIVPRLVTEFTKARMAVQGIVVADVTTAEPLSARGEIEMRARLQEMFGKQVELHMHTDPDIIGGLIVRVGDQLIDGSVVNQLRVLRNRLATGAITP